MEYHKIETLFERDMATFKVDPTKLKNPVYGIFKEWEFTEKIDGTNVRVMWRDHKLTIGGKTDNAQLPAALVERIYATVSVDVLEQKFGDTSVVIYGEGYGAGIQKGAGYSAEKRFIVFDVFIDNKWWLNREQTNDVAKVLGLHTVPFIGTMPLEQAVGIVRNGFYSFQADIHHGSEQFFPAEGLVGRPVETLFDKKGSRIIIKLKTKDFEKETA
jgi:hypothetical protein